MSRRPITATVDGSTVGLMRIFTSGQGSSARAGTVSTSAAGEFLRVRIQTDKKYDEVRMLLDSGAVKETIADPPQRRSRERIRSRRASQGRYRPMTAAIMRSWHRRYFTPGAEQGRVFDGRMRSTSAFVQAA